MEILKETEADSKNLFGRYGSKRMKDWLETIALYEKDNIYLAEAAQMLSRNVSYEVPGIKQQIKKFEQLEKVFWLAVTAIFQVTVLFFLLFLLLGIREEGKWL